MTLQHLCGLVRGKQVEKVFLENMMNNDFILMMNMNMNINIWWWIIFLLELITFVVLGYISKSCIEIEGELYGHEFLTEKLEF